MNKTILLLLPSIDTDALAWRAAALAAGGSVSPRTLKAVSAFCRQSKGLGLWSKLTRVNLWCGDQLNAAKVPLKVGGGSATETLTSIVAADYVETGSTAGVKGDGSAKRFDTGWNPSTLGSLSDAGLWTYVKGTEAAGASHVIMGGQATTSNQFLIGWGSSGTAEIGAIGTLSGSEYAPAGTPAAKEGFLGITTNGSRAQQYYQNGAAVGSPVTASGAFANANVYGLCTNAAGVADLFSTRYLRAYAITTGLSATDAANLNTIMQAFQTALNRNV